MIIMRGFFDDVANLRQAASTPTRRVAGAKYCRAGIF